MWNRPLEDFGRWQIHAGRELPKADDPRTDHRKGADTNLPPRAGIPKRQMPNCHKRRYFQTSVDCSIRKGAGCQRPHCAKGRDPKTPASWRHLLLRVVAATAGRAVVRRLGKFDLRPCPLRLRSSLTVLGCTGLMRSRLPISLDGPRIQFIDKVLNFPVVLRYVAPTVLLFGLT